MDNYESEILVGAFEKNGLVYHVLITPEKTGQEDIVHGGRYRGVFLHPLKRSICQFHIQKDDEGRWIPDERQAIDPWVADNIGLIIHNNLD